MAQQPCGQCKAITRNGTRCNWKAACKQNCPNLCWIHAEMLGGSHNPVEKVCREPMGPVNFNLSEQRHRKWKKWPFVHKSKVARYIDNYVPPFMDRESNQDLDQDLNQDADQDTDQDLDQDDDDDFGFDFDFDDYKYEIDPNFVPAPAPPPVPKSQRRYKKRPVTRSMQKTLRSGKKFKAMIY
jgi:hypothetical protein